ncbi:MAG: rhomboid family intramembrane serine protease [Planctomycetota bacterium]
MGIYDREYYGSGQGPGPGSGPGGRPPGLARLRFMSINTWIIVINVLVFLLDAGLGSAGFTRPVLVDAADGRSGRPVLVDKDYSLRGSGGRVTEEQARGAPIGTTLIRNVYDEESREQVGVDVYTVMYPLEAYGHFSTYNFFRLEVWRLVTFQFLHSRDNIWHLFFNMFGMFVFGGMVEQYLGRKRYAAFYLMCGIAGGLAYLILNLAGWMGLSIPGVLFNDTHTPLIGASAGVFGVIMASAFIAPNSVVQLIFPPIPLKMKWFAYGYVGLAAFNLLTGGRNAGGDAAHLGGAIAGAYFIRNSHLLRDFFDVLNDSRKQGGKKRRSQTASASQAELDRILKKVHEEGLGSLSAKEKRILTQASEREAGRG